MQMQLNPHYILYDPWDEPCDDRYKTLAGPLGEFCCTVDYDAQKFYELISRLKIIPKLANLNLFGIDTHAMPKHELGIGCAWQSRGFVDRWLVFGSLYEAQLTHKHSYQCVRDFTFEAYDRTLNGELFVITDHTGKKIRIATIVEGRASIPLLWTCVVNAYVIQTDTPRTFSYRLHGYMYQLHMHARHFMYNTHATHIYTDTKIARSPNVYDGTGRSYRNENINVDASCVYPCSYDIHIFDGHDDPKLIEPPSQRRAAFKSASYADQCAMLADPDFVGPLEMREDTNAIIPSDMVAVKFTHRLCYFPHVWRITPDGYVCRETIDLRTMYVPMLYVIQDPIIKIETTTQHKKAFVIVSYTVYIMDNECRAAFINPTQ
jgi:hypothetical protein